MRNPAFGVSDQIRHKLGCTTTIEKGDCTIYVAKTKALMSCMVTKQLICAFVFAYAQRSFLHDAAHYLLSMVQIIVCHSEIFTLADDFH